MWSNRAQHTAGGKRSKRQAAGVRPMQIRIGLDLDWIDLMDGWSGLVLLSVAAGGPVAPSQGEAQIQSD